MVRAGEHVVTGAGVTRAETDTMSAVQALLEAGAQAIPGAQHVGLALLGRAGQATTVAATSDLARRLDELQFTLREGPCVDAMGLDGPAVVRIDDDSDRLWPEFVVRARAVGMKGGLAVQLCWQGEPVGSLGLYLTDDADVPDDLVLFAERFATQAAAILFFARKAAHLEHAMISRQVIGQAVGILMERYSMDAQSAFNYLRRVSQNGNRKLRDLASELVETRRLPDDRSRGVA